MLMRLKNLLYALPLAVSGCAATRPFPPAGMPGHEMAGGGGLAETAAATGLVWPVAVGAVVAILSGVGMLLLGSRSTGIILIAVGVLMASANVWALEVLEHLVVPSAWLLGVCGLLGVAYFAGVLWQRWVTKRRLVARGAYIESQVDFECLTPKSVKKLLEHVADRKFNPEEKVTE